MKLAVGFVGIMIGSKESEYTSQNGSKGTTYSLCIEVNDEAGNIPCTKECYESVRSGSVPKYASCVFGAVYDSQYKHLRIESAKVKEKTK